jgi:hypothetical protein
VEVRGVEEVDWYVQSEEVPIEVRSDKLKLLGFVIFARCRKGA